MMSKSMHQTSFSGFQASGAVRRHIADCWRSLENKGACDDMSLARAPGLTFKTEQIV
jgi:hypothetical protein